MEAPNADREAWIKVALRLVPAEYHKLIIPQFHVLMDKTADQLDAALKHAQDTGLSHLDFLHRLPRERVGPAGS